MPTTAYRARWCYDGLGNPPLEDATVTVADGRIAAVRTGTRPAANVIDLGDATLLPGLVDAHVHLVWGAEGTPHREVELDDSATTLLRMAGRARRTLLAGTTTVRDLGATDSLTLPLAAAIERGDIPGPRLVAAGRAIAMTGGHAWQITREADGVDQVRSAVRTEVKAGARVIKLMASGGVYDERAGLTDRQFTDAELRAATQEAHRAGCSVAAHAYTPGPIRAALDAGVNSIEHGSFADEATLTRMAELGVYFVPTAMAAELIVRNARAAGTPDHMVGKAEQVRRAVRHAIKLALHLGTPVAAGTDSGGAGIQHGTLYEEAAILHSCGASVAETIRICTSAGAELCGVADETGTLEPGRRADLIAVEGNLAEDISNLRRVVLVVAGGKIHRKRLTDEIPEQTQ
ncbi:amidohydrolase family protein [Kribbella sp. NPDC050124]|uniref:amidohydrolase family protein n=1 Tax=Kribbella sp. NPDC050124 TaxID=3364114 RepID=UPI003790038B